jgi:hypothetical protein
MSEYFTKAEIDKAEKYYNDRWKVWLIRNLKTLHQIIDEKRFPRAS